MTPNEVTQQFELDPDERELLSLKAEENLWPFIRSGELMQAIDRARVRLLDQFDLPHALPGPQVAGVRTEYLRRLQILGAMQTQIVLQLEEPSIGAEIEDWLRGA